ncbi:MAG: Smr/MutS family protein [Hylemonella sp.]|jgi:DNA-nicking Smr family endonuclease
MSRKVGSLADLKQVKQEIEAQARLAAQRQAEAAAQARRAQSDKEMFTRAVGAVQPMTPNAKVQLKQKPPAPVAMQHHRDEQAVLQEAISDEFDVSTLLDIDEHLSFRRPGIGPDVTRKLRRGDWKIQREIDLHGLRTDDARNALAQFIRKAHREGLRCVRVVHGKGHGSPGKTPVLKNRVHSWLVQKKEVLAFVQARPADGGAGALVLLLVQAG